MKDYLKGIGTQLRQTFDGVVGRPMSWQLIDALCKLDEAEAARNTDQHRAAATPATQNSSQSQQQSRDERGGNGRPPADDDFLPTHATANGARRQSQD